MIIAPIRGVPNTFGFGDYPSTSQFVVQLSMTLSDSFLCKSAVPKPLDSPHFFPVRTPKSLHEIKNLEAEVTS